MAYISLSEIKQKHKKRKLKLEQIAKVDRTNIDKEMSSNSANLFFVGSKKSEADFLLSRADFNLKRVKARAFERIKKKDNLTDTATNQRVLKDPEVIEAQNTYLEMQYLSNLYQSSVLAVKQKGEQITNIGHNYRKELDRGLIKKSKKK